MASSFWARKFYLMKDGMDRKHLASSWAGEGWGAGGTFLICLALCLSRNHPFLIPEAHGLSLPSQCLSPVNSNELS